MGTGVDRLLKPENLSANDPFLNLLAKDVRCLNEDRCDTLTKMVRRKVRKISAPMSWGNLGDESSSFTDLVGELLKKKATPSSSDEVSSPITTLFLDLAGFGHHLIVQIVQVKDLSGQQAGKNNMSSDADGGKNKPLTGQGANFLQANSASYCARLFHCWVKCDAKGGGYTLKEWLRGEVSLTLKNSEGQTIKDIASTKDDQFTQWSSNGWPAQKSSTFARKSMICEMRLTTSFEVTCFFARISLFPAETSQRLDTGLPA